MGDRALAGFFVALPVALRSGLSFTPALALACVATIAAYGLWIAAARLIGADL